MQKAGHFDDCILLLWLSAEDYLTIPQGLSWYMLHLRQGSLENSLCFKVLNYNLERPISGHFGGGFQRRIPLKGTRS